MIKGYGMMFFLRLLICTYLMLSVNVVQSQCIADAGNDTIICGTSSQSLVLGGDVVAQGGTPPFIYKWEAEEYLLNEKKTASFFLDDSTKAHPAFVEAWDKSVSFKLTVTDSLGNTCSDSVKVIFCNYINPSTAYYLVDKGDTATIGMASVPYSGNPDCGSVDFSGWSPDYAISDTSSLSTQVWPDSTVTYYAEFMDSTGCNVPLHAFKVIVEPTGFEEFIGAGNNVKIKPNPFFNQTTFEFQVLGAKVLKVYNFKGEMLREKLILNKRYTFYSNSLPSGLYFYKVFYKDDGQVSFGKFVIN